MAASKKIKIGIVGATGYTGVELLRLLASHEHAEVVVITSRGEAGVHIADYFPNLRGVYDLVFQAPSQADLGQCDAVFFATPHGVAMNEAPELLEKGIKIIDLSADFRLQDTDTWEKWYKHKHGSKDILKEAVYGLCEMNRLAIENARLVAVPGCYPTCVSLPLLPFLKAGALVPGKPLIADCKSGVSGAGRGASVGTLFCETSDNFKAYGVSGHRHLPEIKQTLRRLQNGIAEHFVFVPHLIPMIRGMQATIYVHLQEGLDCYQMLSDFYQGSRFVDVLPYRVVPETRSVRGANICRIGMQRAPESDVWILMSVQDNLVKGAAGQAIQNLNIMFGLDEDAGLKTSPFLP